MDFSKIESELISELHLTPLQVKVFLLVTTKGKMTPEKISSELDIPSNIAHDNCKQLMDLGAFIDLSPTEFEAMHPRFTIVNMYRKMCQRESTEFKRNKKVDNIGVILERFYDSARTK